MGIEEIRRLGFVPVYDDSVFARQRYLAGLGGGPGGGDSAAWRDPSIAGLIGVRGGYGSAQVLPLLDREEARRARKPFIGYSDLTAVLTFLTTGCDGLVAFHGPMLAGRLGRGSAGYDRDSFLAAVCRREPMGELSSPALDTLRPGEASGRCSAARSRSCWRRSGRRSRSRRPGYVLFLDEVGERPYRLDRMVTQLRQTGLLARAAAVVIGELPKCDEPSGDPTARAVMADLFADFPGPVVIGFPSGHTAGPAMTLPFGVSCRVIAGSRPRLVIEEAAVE